VSQIIFLCIFAFLAGFIDSIVGGGGLIQLPALLVFLPNTAIPLIFVLISYLQLPGHRRQQFIILSKFKLTGQ
jgi:uncharacterized membrane protein YfcA